MGNLGPGLWWQQVQPRHIPWLIHCSSIQEEAIATLNIKNFPDELHAALAERAELERRSVAQEVIVLLEKAVQERSSRSIMELAGLGADYWKDTDAAAHVDEERRSWDS